MENVLPLVSIIIPNYNHEKYLEMRLESIFNQTYQNFEVILLDDCSTDNSRAILSEYAKNSKVSHCIFNETNSGNTFSQWNKGIGLANGDFIWIAETDDFCELNFLEELLSPLLKDKQVVLSYCQSNRVNKNDELIGNWITHTEDLDPTLFLDNFVMDGNLFIEKLLIHKNVIPNVSAVLFRKNEIEKIFPLIYKPFMKYNADWFYYIQLLCITKVAFISKSLNHFRYHESSVIAKAGKEISWIKVYKMELQGRKQMLRYIENCKPDNIKAIRKESKKGDKLLKYLTAKGYYNRWKHYFKRILIKLLKTIYLKIKNNLFFLKYNDRK